MGVAQLAEHSVELNREPSLQKKIYAKPSWVKKGWGKHCSKNCQNQGQKKGSLINCFMCDRAVYKPQSDIKKSASKKYFCGKSCQAIWRNSFIYTGNNHKNWAGGGGSYRNILIRNKTPLSCKRCGIDDKRIIVAHHIDKNRKNNALSNLIWLCCNCHFLIHHNIDEYKNFMETLV